jgi:hypothetical protein
MISGVVVLASFPLIALIAAMVAHERQREIGLLMAMGAKRNTHLERKYSKKRNCYYFQENMCKNITMEPVVIRTKLNDLSNLLLP